MKFVVMKVVQKDDDDDYDDDGHKTDKRMGRSWVIRVHCPTGEVIGSVKFNIKMGSSWGG